VTIAPSTTELAIRLRGVVKRYGEITAVGGLDLDVPYGTCVGLLGPNGAGKTTTMRMLTAQAIADEGELEVLGATPSSGSRAGPTCCGSDRSSSSAWPCGGSRSAR
jgi:ABC-type multidrug transport system ATPase subunit